MKVKIIILLSILALGLQGCEKTMDDVLAEENIKNSILHMEEYKDDQIVFYYNRENNGLGVGLLRKIDNKWQWFHDSAYLPFGPYDKNVNILGAGTERLANINIRIVYGIIVDSRISHVYLVEKSTHLLEEAKIVPTKNNGIIWFLIEPKIKDDILLACDDEYNIIYSSDDSTNINCEPNELYSLLN